MVVREIMDGLWSQRKWVATTKPTRLASCTVIRTLMLFGPVLVSSQMADLFSIYSARSTFMLNTVGKLMQHCCSHLRTKQMLNDVEDDVWWKSRLRFPRNREGGGGARKIERRKGSPSFPPFFFSLSLPSSRLRRQRNLMKIKLRSTSYNMVAKRVQLVGFNKVGRCIVVASTCCIRLAGP